MAQIISFGVPNDKQGEEVLKIIESMKSKGNRVFSNEVRKALKLWCEKYTEEQLKRLPGETVQTRSIKNIVKNIGDFMKTLHLGSIYHLSKAIDTGDFTPNEIDVLYYFCRDMARAIEFAGLKDKPAPHRT